MTELCTNTEQPRTEFNVLTTTENNEMESLVELQSELISICIWYCDDDELSRNLQSEMKRHLKELSIDLCVYCDLVKYMEYLQRKSELKEFCFIITSKLADSLFLLVTVRFPAAKVYQFQPDSISTINPNIFTDLNQLLIQIRHDFKTDIQNHQSSLSDGRLPSIYHESRLFSPHDWSLWNPTKKEDSFQYWKKESPEFFLTQMLSQVLVEKKCDHNDALDKIAATCRSHYINYPNEVSKIDTFARDYRPEHAIEHYTKDSFLFRLVGKAFRSEDLNNIHLFHLYIFDLNGELIRKRGQIRESEQENVSLYRGKKLHVAVLQKLIDNIGALISINGFLSTTRSLHVAKTCFAGADQYRHEYRSVIFEYCFNEKNIVRAYADISEMSQFPDEEEILFSIGSIWRIDSIEKDSESESVWIVKLSTCYEVDSKIKESFQELQQAPTIIMIGNILYELGALTKAENFYSKAIDDDSIDNGTRYILYINIATIKMKQEKYSEALDFFSKAEQIMPTEGNKMNLDNLQTLHLRSIIKSRFSILNNMAMSYQKIGKSDEAMDCLREALTIDDEIELIDKATVHHNMGLIFFNSGQYAKAVDHFSKAVQFAQGYSISYEYNQHLHSAQCLVKRRDIAQQGQSN